jgi:hypothetical protein
MTKQAIKKLIKRIERESVKGKEMQEGKLTRISVNSIWPIAIIIGLVKARNCSDIFSSVYDRIGQLDFLFCIAGKNRIVIKLIYHVNVCHGCGVF